MKRVGKVVYKLETEKLIKDSKSKIELLIKVLVIPYYLFFLLTSLLSILVNHFYPRVKNSFTHVQNEILPELETEKETIGGVLPTTENPEYDTNYKIYVFWKRGVLWGKCKNPYCEKTFPINYKKPRKFCTYTGSANCKDSYRNMIKNGKIKEDVELNFN